MTDAAGFLAQAAGFLAQAAGFLAQAAGWALLLGGSAFVVIGALGILRLPDIYARLHGAGITDTLGAVLILAGLLCQGASAGTAVKLILLAVLVLLTSPAATHAVANAAHASGLRPAGGQPVRADAKEPTPWN